MKYTCCICGKEFEGWGNNPWPVGKTTEKCCDKCNMEVVIPARIEMINKEKNIEVMKNA